MKEDKYADKEEIVLGHVGIPALLKLRSHGLNPSGAVGLQVLHTLGSEEKKNIPSVQWQNF